MPRGGRSRARSSGFSAPPRSSVPATRPASNVATQQPSVPHQGPGLFGQMASTAAGVAVGSTVGHVVGGALTSGYHNNPDSAQNTSTGEQRQTNDQTPCQFEFQQFVQCAQNEHDISMCKGFNEVLKQCKKDNGLI